MGKPTAEKELRKQENLRKGAGKHSHKRKGAENFQLLFSSFCPFQLPRIARELRELNFFGIPSEHVSFFGITSECAFLHGGAPYLRALRALLTARRAGCACPKVGRLRVGRPLAGG